MSNAMNWERLKEYISKRIEEWYNCTPYSVERAPSLSQFPGLWLDRMVEYVSAYSGWSGPTVREQIFAVAMERGYLDEGPPDDPREMDSPPSNFPWPIDDSCDCGRGYSSGGHMAGCSALRD